MADISDFMTALEAAQSKSKFTEEVQAAAVGIDPATLKAAVAAAGEMGETGTLPDAEQAAALKAGFEFAAKLVMMLKSAPGPYEKKDLYVYFKIARKETLEKPAFYDMIVCYPPFFLFLLFSLSLRGLCCGLFANVLSRFCRRSSSTASGRRSTTTATRRRRLSISRT